MFWLIGTAFALHNFLTLTTLGAFTRVFQDNRDLLGFGGVWALREIPGPNRQKTIDPKNRKKVEFYFSLRFQKMCFRHKRSDFFFVFGPLAPPIGAVRTEKA